MRILKRATEAGPEDSIHHQFRPVEHVRNVNCSERNAAPQLRMMPRGTVQMIPRTEQGDANGPARFGELPGRDETVTAIVAGSTEHDYTGRADQRFSIPWATALPAFSINSMTDLPPGNS
jgi:hypothetical protein